MNSTNFTLDQLARFAVNQLVSGTCLDEVCENFSIFERLDNQAKSQFFGLVEEKTLALYMVLDDDYLRPMTDFEMFIHNAKAQLLAYEGSEHLILESGSLHRSIALDRVPEIIVAQRIPLTAVGLIALVYFQAKEGL